VESLFLVIVHVSWNLESMAWEHR